MTKASFSLAIAAPADKVWQLIGGFGSLPDWLPFIPKVDLSEGGRVRTFHLPDGGEVVERLETFSNATRSYTYSIVQAPAPVTNYLSTIRVLEKDGDKGCVVQWWGTFTPAGVSEVEAEKVFLGLYESGLGELRAAFAK